MKKVILTFVILFTLILTTSLYASAQDYDTIKVGLYYGETAKNSVTINVDEGLSYGYHDGTTHREVGTLWGQSFTIAAYSDTEVIINDSQIVNSAENFSLMPIGGNISVEGSAYRGGIIFENEEENLLTVINILPLEHYLYGVIASEMPSSWNIEALKAQAVCARGFAVSNYNKHTSLGFNVCATTNCQMYGGIPSECEAVIEAVDSTCGLVVTHEGEIIESLFYSASGGHTANVKNVWGSYIPYLSGVPDPYEPEDAPRHTWSATLTLDDIQEVLDKNDIDIGTVESLEVLNDETGRAYELTVYGTEDSYTFKRQQTYSPFFDKGVKSQKYTISPISSSTSKKFFVMGADETLRTSKFSAVSSNGKTVSLGNTFSVVSSNGTQTITAGDSAGGYLFTGGGYGHGVGMSQYGAKGMADLGHTYDEILAYYYPGTEIDSLY